MEGADRLLASLDVSATDFVIAEAALAGRSTALAREDPLALYVLSGHGLLSATGHPEIGLEPDAFVVAPPGAALAAFASATQPDGVHNRLVVAIGGLRASVAGGVGLFSALDAPIVHRFGAAAFRESFLMLADELRAPALGSRALADGVLRQALILLIRSRWDGAGATCPWIVAMREPRLLPALSAMLDRPADPFSLDALARMAGMSRSVFSGRFVAAFGAPPMEFLKQVRLGQAARLLSTTNLPVKKIARVVGYESRSYFSRAFRARYELDPSDYRSRGQAGAPASASCS